MSPMRRDSGFTLMEVLVALVVAGTVALLLHRGIGELNRFGARAAAVRREAAEAAAVRRQLASWLRGVYADPTPEGARRFEGTDGGREAEGADRLSFWTSALSWERSGAQEITLAVEPGTGLVATLRDRTTTQGADSGRKIVLVPGAEGLELRYFMVLGGERRWLNGWTSSVSPPEAVEIRIQGAGVPPLLKIPILVAHGG